MKCVKSVDHKNEIVTFSESKDTKSVLNNTLNYQLIPYSGAIWVVQQTGSRTTKTTPKKHYAPLSGQQPNYQYDP